MTAPRRKCRATSSSRICIRRSGCRSFPFSARMCRQQMIDQQLSQQNAMDKQMYGSSEALGSQTASGYQNLLANPGYTPAEQSAITNLSQSALSSSFDALGQNP